VVAPAIGPAIYLAVGVPVKDVPIPAEAVKRAL
jgi:CO/xanthine dehydrogenase Mo-binding subunit